MLDIKIFNVDHGFCATINTGDRHTILLDCGYNSQTGFCPTQYIFQQHHWLLDGVILPAYSPDHLASFPDLLTQSLEHGSPINSLIANPSLHSTQFPELAVSTQHLNNVLSLTTKAHPECSQISHSMTINDIYLTFFWNNYPDFQNVHNLSLVTFLSYRDLHVIFPSDLEVEGWQSLLQCHDFRTRLKKVNTFVAADHGREAGYCPEVFHYCAPEVIIISSQTGQSISPWLLQRYESHINSSRFGIADKPLLMTHEDGMITISKYLDATRCVSAQPKTRSYYRYQV